MINIVVIDDHKMFAEMLVQSLKTVDDFQVVGVFNTGEDFLLFLNTEYAKINIVVLDLSLPGIDGVGVLEKLLSFPNIRTIVLTSFNELGTIHKTSRIGAKGYVSKLAKMNELHGAIKKVAGGDTYICQESLNLLTKGFKNKDYKVNYNAELSERENEIIKLIALEYSTYEIAEKLSITENAINTHRKNIIKKLGVTTIVGLVRYAYEKQLIL
jgi:DNA-binding NarL/FixJ family response regulator